MSKDESNTLTREFKNIILLQPSVYKSAKAAQFDNNMEKGTC